MPRKLSSVPEILRNTVLRQRSLRSASDSASRPPLNAWGLVTEVPPQIGGELRVIVPEASFPVVPATTACAGTDTSDAPVGSTALMVVWKNRLGENSVAGTKTWLP